MGTTGPALPSQRKRLHHTRSGSVQLTTHFTWSIFRFPWTSLWWISHPIFSYIECHSIRHNIAAARWPPSRLSDILARALMVFVQWNALQRANTNNSKQIFPEKELRGHSPNFQIHVSVIDLYIPTLNLPILLLEIFGIFPHQMTQLPTEHNSANDTKRNCAKKCFPQVCLHGI